MNFVHDNRHTSWLLEQCNANNSLALTWTRNKRLSLPDSTFAKMSPKKKCKQRRAKTMGIYIFKHTHTPKSSFCVLSFSVQWFAWTRNKREREMDWLNSALTVCTANEWKNILYFCIPFKNANLFSSRIINHAMQEYAVSNKVAWMLLESGVPRIVMIVLMIGKPFATRFNEVSSIDVYFRSSHATSMHSQSSQVSVSKAAKPNRFKFVKPQIFERWNSIFFACSFQRWKTNSIFAPQRRWTAGMCALLHQNHLGTIRGECDCVGRSVLEGTENPGNRFDHFYC